MKLPEIESSLRIKILPPSSRFLAMIYRSRDPSPFLALTLAIPAQKLNIPYVPYSFIYLNVDVDENEKCSTHTRLEELGCRDNTRLAAAASFPNYPRGHK